MVSSENNGDEELSLIQSLIQGREEFGQDFKLIRLDEGISLWQLSEILDVDEEKLVLFEQGKEFDWAVFNKATSWVKGVIKRKFPDDKALQHQYELYFLLTKFLELSSEDRQMNLLQFIRSLE